MIDALDESNIIELPGVDGGNPLGFLAAIGAFRMAACTSPNDDVRLSWLWRRLEAMLALCDASGPRGAC